MALIDTVLAFKQQKDQQAQADLLAIPQAITAFNNAHQARQLLDIEKMKVDSDLRNIDSLIRDRESQIKKRDTPDLVEETLKKAKLVEASKTLNDRALYNSLMGVETPTTSQPTTSIELNNQQQNATTDINSLPDQKLYELSQQQDEFLGKSTPLALQAKDILKRREEDLKPLAGDTSAKYSGAKLGIKNINDIVKDINNYQGDQKQLIREANLAIEAENAKDTFIPGLKGAYKVSKLSRVSDSGKKLANSFSTLAESLLRARTGAAAPDPEIVREYARTLLKTFQESPETWNQKLQNDFNFLKSVHDEIRPSRKYEATLEDVIRLNEPEERKKSLRFPLKSESNDPNYTYGDAALDTAKTIGNSLADLGEVLAKPVTNPAETLNNIASAVLHPGQTVQGLADYVVNTYGTPEKVAEKVSKDPFGFVSDIAAAGYGGAGLKNMLVSSGKESTLVNSYLNKANRLERLNQANQSILEKSTNFLKDKVPATKEKAFSTAFNTVKEARNNIQNNYMFKNYEIYGKRLENVKELPNKIQNKQTLIDIFDDYKIDGKFQNARIANAFERLNSKKNLTEGDVVREIKSLTKDYKHKMNFNQREAYDISHKLIDNLPETSKGPYKVMQADYAVFKNTVENLELPLGRLSGKSLKDWELQDKVDSLLMRRYEKPTIDTLNTVANVSGISDFTGTMNKMAGSYKFWKNVGINIGGVNPIKVKESLKSVSENVPDVKPTILKDTLNKLKKVNKETEQLQIQKELDAVKKLTTQPKPKISKQAAAIKKEYMQFKKNPPPAIKSIKERAAEARKLMKKSK